jgi:hypothetical protein
LFLFLPFEYRVCFGLDSPPHHLFARFLAEKLKPVKTLDVAIGFKDLSPPAVREIADFVVETRKKIKA